MLTRRLALLAGLFALIASGASAQDLEIQTLREGRGAGANTGQMVSVHYVGTLTDGAQFDSSRDRGQPFSFRLGEGRVIQGWEQGVIGMKRGELRRLVVPPSLGYGFRRAGAIPPNSTLIFEIEMIEIR